MKERPGTSSLTFFLYRPSERFVQLAKPPIEVTAALPIRTWFEAFTVAPAPRAVLLITLSVASANEPIKVLEKLLPVKPAPTPKAALSLPVVFPANAEPPPAVLRLPAVLKNKELKPRLVLPVPMVLARKEATPLAVLAVPVVLARKAV